MIFLVVEEAHEVEVTEYFVVEEDEYQEEWGDHETV